MDRRPHQPNIPKNPHRHSKPLSDKHQIEIKPSHAGLLHEKLHVPAGQPIPASKLEQALHSQSPELRKEANFAKNAKKFKH